MDVAFNRNVDESFTSSRCTENCETPVSLPVESSQNQQVKKTVI